MAEEPDCPAFSMSSEVRRNICAPPQSLFLVPALEDKKLMAQGKDFCLEGSSRTERITEENKHGNQDRIIAKKPTDVRR